MKGTGLAVPVLLVGCWLLSSWLLPATAFAEPIPALRAVPTGLPPEVQTKLGRDRESLSQELQVFLADARRFNAKPAEAQTDAEFAALGERRARYIRKANAYNEEVTNAASLLKGPKNQTHSAPKPEVDLPGPEGRRVIKGINALAKQLGWSVDKQARLDRALNSLGIDPATWSDRDQIQRIWHRVLTRGQSADLVREASQGGGLGFPGAGKQTTYTDCSVFALANAAGLPYGVVAARAAELIRQGEWRRVDERAYPQKVIEQEGLMGGEVVMLAEAFGRAEVVPFPDFTKTLQGGSPVLVNVMPKSGDARFGHEVVLTKTFQHGGETWYVMMDSNQGPQQRLFLSAKELNTMLKENGVAFYPEPKTTPKLLRE
jgi:hypothetical protein